MNCCIRRVGVGTPKTYGSCSTARVWTRADPRHSATLLCLLRQPWCLRRGSRRLGCVAVPAAARQGARPTSQDVRPRTPRASGAHVSPRKGRPAIGLAYPCSGQVGRWTLAEGKKGRRLTAAGAFGRSRGDPVAWACLLLACACLPACLYSPACQVGVCSAPCAGTAPPSPCSVRRRRGILHAATSSLMPEACPRSSSAAGFLTS
jgi:hypothetical protein